MADSGYTVTDNYDKPSDIKVVVSGTFYPTFPLGANPSVTGNYTVIYTATDKSGNKAVLTKTIKVQDRTAPVVSLIGTYYVTVCRWFNYIDSGYTVTDNYDSVKYIKVDTIGNFKTNGGTSISNFVSIRYRAVYRAGNIGLSESRIITALPEADPACVSGIQPGLSLDRYIYIYPNPNSGVFTINANLPQAQETHITVINMLGQQIGEIHNGVLGKNSFKVDMKNEPSGIYFLSIISGNQVVTKKIEITK